MLDKLACTSFSYIWGKLPKDSQINIWTEQIELEYATF